MANKRLAVSLILGCILSLVGPDDSAANSCIPLYPNSGNRASEITIIPKPPIQWVKLRQNSMPCDNSSILFKIEAPVVVKPDMVSKNASVNDGMLPLSQNGNMPNR